MKKTIKMVLRILFISILIIQCGVLFSQDKIVWENGDQLKCKVLSYGKDTIIFQLEGSKLVQKVNTNSVKQIQIDGDRNRSRKKVEYVSGSTNNVRAVPNFKRTYKFQDKILYRSGWHKQLSVNFGMQSEQEGGINVTPNLKFSSWKKGRGKLSLGGIVSYTNYSPSEKKMFITPAVGLYYVPSKRASFNLVAELGYGYSSAKMVNFLDRDFNVNVLSSKGGLYSGLWIEKQLFGFDKKAVNLTAGISYQKGSFEIESFEGIFIFKTQEIDFIRIWFGTGIRF